MSVRVKALLLVSALLQHVPKATAFSFPTFIRETPFCHPTREWTVLSSSSDSSHDDNDDSAFDMKELQRRMDKQMTQYYDLLTSTEDDVVRPEFVYIIVFNPNENEEQGVHTIEFPKGSGNNVILAFENDDDCVAFAQMLKNTNMPFYNPIPQMANLDELEVFCQGLEVQVKVVSQGKDLRPPADNVEELSMNPNLRQDKTWLNRAFMASDSKDNENTDDLESAWE